MILISNGSPNSVTHLAFQTSRRSLGLREFRLRDLEWGSKSNFLGRCNVPHSRLAACSVEQERGQLATVLYGAEVPLLRHAGRPRSTCKGFDFAKECNPSNGTKPSSMTKYADDFLNKERKPHSDLPAGLRVKSHPGFLFWVPGPGCGANHQFPAAKACRGGTRDANPLVSNDLAQQRVR